MAFKDWMNNLRDYFVEDDEEFNEPARPVQESRPTVASTPKPKVEERKAQPEYQTRRPAQSTSKAQTQTAAPKRAGSTFTKPLGINS
mgnify:FL=1